MNKKLIELAEQRAELMARVAEQRAELARVLSSWRGPLNVVDQGWAAIRYLRGNPIILGGMVAFLVALRPWRIGKWVPPGWLLWRLVRMALGPKGMLRGH
ncbi:MAG: YqjK-like family protein [Syntrophaceae bacterium]|nr:YqjK-like family protein [Syntrophaceae bacterium]